MNCCLSHLSALQTVAYSPRLLCEMLLIPTVNSVNCRLYLLTSLWTSGSFTCMPDLKIVADHNCLVYELVLILLSASCAVVYPICLLCELVLIALVPPVWSMSWWLSHLSALWASVIPPVCFASCCLSHLSAQWVGAYPTCLLCELVFIPCLLWHSVSCLSKLWDVAYPTHLWCELVLISSLQ
jgi:hypothetical protein